MRCTDLDGRNVNPAILTEEPFRFRDAYDNIKKSRGFVEYLTREGRRSPVTRKLVKLECAVTGDLVLVTSKAAYARYEARLNGAKV